MSLASLLGTLLPSYEAIQLKNQLKKSADAMSTELLPAYQQLQELVATKQGKPFLSKGVNELDEQIVNYLRNSKLDIPGLRHASMLEYIIPALTNINNIVSFLNKCIDKDMGRNVTTSTMTFNKAVVLQFIDIITFATLYSSTLLNYVTAEELAAVEGSNIAVKGVAPPDVKYLNANVVVYAIALRVLNTSIAKLQSEYAEIPEAVFDESSWAELASTFGRDKVDPLGFSSVPFPLSMVLRVRLIIAERQMDNYDECVSAGKAAEMRVLMIRKQMAEGQSDAAMEKLLNHYENRLNELKYERARLEKKYGLD